MQGELERVLTRLERTPVTVVGAGRTDAGVHALGYAASFTAKAELGAGAAAGAMNALLPGDDLGPPDHADGRGLSCAALR